MVDEKTGTSAKNCIIYNQKDSFAYFLGNLYDAPQRETVTFWRVLKLINNLAQASGLARLLITYL
jgi:hypothetical protein